MGYNFHGEFQTFLDGEFPETELQIGMRIKIKQRVYNYFLEIDKITRRTECSKHKDKEVPLLSLSLIHISEPTRPY